MNYGLIIQIFLTLSFFFLTPKAIFARDSFITVVNPVRISGYTKNSAETIRAQAGIVKQLSLPATWLATFDVLENEAAVLELKALPLNHEVGLFLEIGPLLSQNAKVSYKKPDEWYHPNGLFLSGYSQEERKRLIDALFSKFKEKFGYYPSSVGSWWTDSYSLQYMKDKYNVVSALMCSDQFATDNYQLWGQFWGAPYFPSKLHAGEPGRRGNLIPLVMLPWAYRDPLRGYRSSLYSTQDYFTTAEKLDISYFQKILETYLFDSNNSFGHAVVGLEGDFNPEAYSANFLNQLKVVANLKQEKGVSVLTMKSFSDWYLGKFSETPKAHFVVNDLLGNNETVEWYENTFYRVGMKYEKDNKEVIIFDFRSYDPYFKEPYFNSPNRQNTLSVVTPSIIDTMMNPQSEWRIPLVRSDIELKEREIVFKKQIDIPTGILNNPLLELKKEDNFQVLSMVAWKYPKDGLLTRAFTPEAKSLFASTKFRLLVVIVILLFIILLFKKYRLLSLLVVFFLVAILFVKGTDLYLVTPGELQALSYLRTLSEGLVLVPNTSCLQCEYHTDIKPVVFTNNRSYVSHVSSKKIVSDNGVFTAQREEIKNTFKTTGAKYIYLTKIENYAEKLPYSPGDTGVKKVFENANATIWEKE